MRKYWKRKSVRGQLIRKLMIDVTATHYLGEKIKTGEIRANPIEPEWHCPKEFQWNKIEREHYVLEVIEPKENKNNRYILQLHGGGYIGPMKNAYRNFAVKYSKLNGNCTVITPDYRIAPEYPYPSALLDCVDAYLWLKEQGISEEQIVIVGDSAGGGLTFALGLWLKDHKFAMPKAMITMSPWTDVTCSGKSYKVNFDKDPLFGNTDYSMLQRKDYVGEHDPKDPYISPLFGDLTGFPPIHMQAGSCEMLLSDTLEFGKKAEAQGVFVEMVIFEGMFHVFPMAGALVPETKAAWRRIEKFLEEMYDGNEE